MHLLAQRLFGYIRRQELLQAGDRVGVAVSGGIDSIALLRLLLDLRHELGIVLSVVHFNHKLRGAESDGDEQFVASLARHHDLEFHVDSDDVAAVARAEHASVENAARELRYGFFRSLLGESGTYNPPGGEAPVDKADANRSAKSAAPSRDNSFLNKIATGHTLDDQAETVLMRLIRGAGLRGLGGIYPRIPVEDDDGEVCGEIVRPLLAFRRRELEQYVSDLGQPWHEDSTNAEEDFTRNRVRKLVVPLLEKEFNPAVAENLSELAEIARGEEDYWENEISGWMGTAVHWSEPAWARDALRGVSGSAQGLVQIGAHSNPAQSNAGAQHSADASLRSRIDNAPWMVMNASIGRMWFLGEPIAVQRRLIKAIGEHAGIPLEFKHVEEILHLAAEDSGTGKELSLPLGWKMFLEPEQLVFETPNLREPDPPRSYEYQLLVPGRVTVRELGSEFEIHSVPDHARAEYNPEHLLDAESLPRLLTVRNWRAGDRFWPAHTKSPKKIKELLQERHVAQPERKLWPVVANGDEIVWMRGFLVPAEHRARAGRKSVVILEKPLASGPTAE